MRLFFLFFLLCKSLVFCVDFDCIVVGSSPFSLFEALYRHHLGQRVLILEEAAECGGAWKTIDICGIPHADLGCHQIGQNIALKDFLEEYAGCRFVAMDSPFQPYHSASDGQNGYYFLNGCFELIDRLMQLIQKTDIVLLLNSKAETVRLDYDQKIATVYTKELAFTTSKIVVTPMSSLDIENPPSPHLHPHRGSQQYYHLYLLIQDSTPPRFTYRSGISSGVSRLMNLTHFIGLTDTGRQLVVVQTHGDSFLKNSETVLAALKAQNLLDQTAYILKEEPYIYKTGYDNQSFFRQFNQAGWELFDLLQTGHFQGMANYVEKWKQALKPFE